MIKALILSVFNPKRISKDIIEKHIVKIGFVFILIRWTYYTIVFSFFRDYKNDWAPFFNPPFGLKIDTYAFWQGKLSILFGFLLMSTISFGLFIYFRTRDKFSISFIKILNILGFSYFIPFIIVQPLDKLTINIFGWNPLIITPLHTIILFWEAIIGVILIDKIYQLILRDKIIVVFLQIIIWIALCALFWR